MPEFTTNLMPRERKHSLSREYYVRAAVIALWFVTLLAVISGILMFPTYQFLAQSFDAKQAELEAVEAKAAAQNEASISARLTALSSAATTLKKLGQAATVTSIIRGALAIPHTGISISGLSYTPQNGKTPASLVILGTADTRDALRSYQVALQSASFAKSADLPVSAYAKDSGIPFSINVTLAL